MLLWYMFVLLANLILGNSCLLLCMHACMRSVSNTLHQHLHIYSLTVQFAFKLLPCLNYVLHFGQANLSWNLCDEKEDVGDFQFYRSKQY